MEGSNMLKTGTHFRQLLEQRRACLKIQNSQLPRVSKIDQLDDVKQDTERWNQDKRVV